MGGRGQPGNAEAPTAPGNLNVVNRANVIHGLEPFRPEYKWNVYQKRLEQSFIMNDVTVEGKKKAILLTVIGSEICDWDLFAPVDPADDTVSYDEICRKLTEHFVPNKIEIAERFRFYQRRQKQDESVANFALALKNLAKDCVFGNFLTSALRDCFVIGLGDPRIQTKLLTEANLTFDAAMKIALSMEAANHQTIQLRQGEAEQIHQMKKSSTCWRCGEGHNPGSCSFRNLECFKCKKKGHRASKCSQRSAGQQRSKFEASRESSKTREDKHVHFTETEPITEQFEDIELYHLPGGPNKSDSTRPSRPIKVEFLVDGHRLEMEVDTGAGYSLISESEWKRFGKPKLKPTNLKLTTYTGEPVELRGEYDAKVQMGTQQHILPTVPSRNFRSPP